MYQVYQSQAAAFIRPFISSFFFLSNFQHWNVSSYVSRELWGLKDWNLYIRGQWADVSYIPKSGCCCLFVHLFLHFSFQFSTLNFFVTLFSGTMRPRRLKISTHWTVGRFIMYIRIRLLLLIHPFISLFFFLSNFQHWTFSSLFSQELWGLEDWNLEHT